MVSHHWIFINFHPHKIMKSICLISILFSFMFISLRAQDNGLYQSVISGCVFDKTPLRGALNDVFDRFKKQHPSLDSPTLILVNTSNFDVWDSPMITADIPKMPFGAILKTICDAGLVDILILGDIVIVSKSGIVRDEFSTMISIPDETKIGSSAIDRMTSDNKIEELLKIYIKNEKMPFSIERLGETERFLVKGSMDVVNIVESVVFLSVKNIKLQPN